MKSPQILALLSLLAPLPAMAMPPPPPGDFLKTLLTERLRVEGATDALRLADADYASVLVDDPGSVYAEVTTSSPLQNELAWEDAREHLADLGHDVTSEEALAIQQWDMGFTKARPGEEAPEVPYEFRAAVIGAHAVKAGVEADIFWKALDISPYGHYTLGAQYAVAAQMLRERIAAVDAVHADEDSRASAYLEQGLRKDVYDHFMQARSPGEFSDSDAFYLTRMLEGATGRWSAGGLSVYGHREIPAMFRISRIAAGYAMRRQQVSSTCDGSGVRVRYPDRDASDPTLFCLNDMTDRAVLHWYAEEHHRQLAEVPVRDVSTLERFRHAIGRLVGFGVDIITTVGIPEFDILPAAEAVELKLVGALVEDGTVAAEDASLASERALALTCGAAK